MTLGLGIAAPIIAQESVSLLTEWLLKSDEGEAMAGEPPPIDLARIRTQLATLLDQPDAQLGECPGVLLYSATEVAVGTDVTAPSELAVGFLVSKGDVLCNARTLVGLALSQNGNVTAHDVLFVPSFSQVTLTLPKAQNGGNWLQWATESAYGKEISSGETLSIGPPVPTLRAHGWDR
jgi:hypothetical protein